MILYEKVYVSVCQVKRHKSISGLTSETKGVYLISMYLLLEIPNTSFPYSCKERLILVLLCGALEQWEHFAAGRASPVLGCPEVYVSSSVSRFSYQC